MAAFAVFTRVNIVSIVVTNWRMVVRLSIVPYKFKDLNSMP